MPTNNFTNKFLTTNSCAVIAAPFSGGQPKGGVELGPPRMLEAGLLDMIEGLDWKVEIQHNDFNALEKECKKVVDTRHIKNASFVSKTCQTIHEQIKKHAALGQMILTLGGDHSLGMATVSGTAAVHKNLGVIWVDAHADINTVDSTDTGNLHGCPVSFLTGLTGQVEGFEWLKPCLETNKICFIGLRDVDEPEKKILKENNIKAFSMYHVDKYGISKVVEMCLEYLGKDTPIHLSFDVDALDPSVAPSTGTPVRGGLSFREGHYICEALHESGQLVGIDIMEVNPALALSDEQQIQTINVGCSLARSALGETLL
ncbi:Arginase, catabolizes arginine to ornithine and urea [Lobulomyces angularis]|nr:Arginase, catabolizes arginine to ornithine and urea [Lobulomyces angularis]